KIRKWGHDRISTYGIGKEHSRGEWQVIGREIIRLGYCTQAAEKFSVVELTDEGMEVLRAPQPVKLTRPITAPEKVARTKSHKAGEISCDEELFRKLRVLRK